MGFGLRFATPLGRVSSLLSEVPRRAPVMSFFDGVGGGFSRALP